MLKETLVVINGSEYILNILATEEDMTLDELKYTLYEILKHKLIINQFVTNVEFLKENIRNNEVPIKMLFIMSKENYDNIKNIIQANKAEWEKYIKSYTENTNGYISLCKPKDFENPVDDKIFDITIKFLISLIYYDKSK